MLSGTLSLTILSFWDVHFALFLNNNKLIVFYQIHQYWSREQQQNVDTVQPLLATNNAPV